MCQMTDATDNKLLLTSVAVSTAIGIACHHPIAPELGLDLRRVGRTERGEALQQRPAQVGVDREALGSVEGGRRARAIRGARRGGAGADDLDRWVAPGRRDRGRSQRAQAATPATFRARGKLCHRRDRRGADRI